MGNRKIIMVTGGERSGKSAFSESLALRYSDHPVYLATARVVDDEFRERVSIHRARRGPQWTTVEEQTRLSDHDMTGRVVLVDCVTMWIANVFFGNGEDRDESLRMLKDEFDLFTSRDATYIFVTNEIGSGVIPADPVSRRFVDLQGWFNQHIAAGADEVYMTVAGIPVKIK